MDITKLDKANNLQRDINNIDGILEHPELASITVQFGNRFLGEMKDGQTYVKGGYAKLEGELKEAVIKSLTNTKNKLLKEIEDL